MDSKRLFLWIIVLSAIAGTIFYLETHKPGRSGTTPSAKLNPVHMPPADKSKKFDQAKEIVQPAGFINTKPLTLSDLVGKKIIMVDFWTYSCINCQRTLPYLNAWHEKYGDKGLAIVGVHTPEFEFEQKKENVQAAVEKYSIHYPVVLDNEYATWKAYGNRYWPRKYLIDIDGYIVYDHIGEGAYEETEKKIQELLQERSDRLGTNESISDDVTAPQDVSLRSNEISSPEIYFGSARNEYLENGLKLKTGLQELIAPITTPLNQLFMVGSWDIQPEYAQNSSSPASIIFRYRAKDVYIVASSASPVVVQVLRDGQYVGSAAGADVDQIGNESVVTISQDRLYRLVEDSGVGEHMLELRIESPGLRAFTFTFG